MNLRDYCLFLLVMAGVTYLLRAVPFVLLKGKIKSRFWRSFLAYVPYTVLAAMTVPAIFYSTNSCFRGRVRSSLLLSPRSSGVVSWVLR